MAVHDWTRVDAGIFHGFHTVWIGAVNHVLKAGLLPPGYYSIPEQHAGRFITDVLTLHASPASAEPTPPMAPRDRRNGRSRGAAAGSLEANNWAQFRRAAAHAGDSTRSRWKRPIKPRTRTRRSFGATYLKRPTARRGP